VLTVVALAASSVVMVAAYRRSDDAAAGRAGGRLVTACAVGLAVVGLTALVIVVAGGVAGRS
jgi:hypothetical protein